MSLASVSCLLRGLPGPPTAPPYVEVPRLAKFMVSDLGSEGAAFEDEITATGNPIEIEAIGIDPGRELADLLDWVEPGVRGYAESLASLRSRGWAIGLVGLFITHIVIALSITRENRAARKVGYAMRQSKQEGRIAMEGARPDLYMALTGAVILGFLILHLMDFRLELRDAKFYEDASGKDLEPYDKAMALLSSSNLITIAGYALGSFALLAHLAHGFQSAFQTLGLNHPKYTPIIKFLSVVFAVTVALGFGSFPLWAWAFQS